MYIINLIAGKIIITLTEGLELTFELIIVVLR
jgi:hypothetical protein